MYTNKNYTNTDYTTVAQAHHLHLPQLGYLAGTETMRCCFSVGTTSAIGCPVLPLHCRVQGKHSPAKRDPLTFLGLIFIAPVKQDSKSESFKYTRACS